MFDHIKKLEFKNEAWDLMQEMGEGSFKTCSGWIHINAPKKPEDNGEWVIDFTSSKNSHNPLSCRAYSIYYPDSEHIKSVFQSALSLHYVYEKEERIEIAKILDKKIKTAYNLFRLKNYVKAKLGIK